MLGNLLEFLRLEVESEERLQLARSGFANDQFEKLKTKENIPTAACIVSNEKQRAEKNGKHFLDEKKICGAIPRVEDPDIYPILKRKNIRLSDTGEYVPEIGLLIGADYLGALLTGRIEPLIIIGSYYNKTGWTLQGKQRTTQNLWKVLYMLIIGFDGIMEPRCHRYRCPAEVKSKQVTDEETVDFFRKTIKRNEDKRYEVCLPWKSGRPELETNKELATKRLMSTTKNLIRSGHLREYDDVFKEWVRDGIIEIVDKDEKKGHYLPHHPVIKTGVTTTKIRPVFDASTTDSKGNSLNNCLEKGPNLLELVPKLIMQFRKKDIGITSDIKKAFLQISLNPEDREYFKCLWWKDLSRREEIITLRHCRVVFGASPSPFLLEATIAYHLETASDERKHTSCQLKESFYVDNCITSLVTKEEAEKFISEAKELMSAAQFELRGWVTSEKIVEETHDKFISILGLSWDTETDELFCGSMVEIPEKRITKRVVLSAAQRLFDPIGITCPVSLIPKVLLQNIWKRKINWDDVLPIDISNRFLAWVKKLSLLKECKIPRRLVSGPFEDCRISLHCFCDASEVSYAACIFLRSEFNEKISVKLVTSKSRVAPTKEITIPRLELLGALILSRLYGQVVDGLELKDNTVYFWTDSTVALTWIKRESSWNTFVGNRVTEIRKNRNPNDWHFVPGHMNPADFPSRGCDAKNLLKSEWWEGPEWLWKSQEFWPLSEKQVIDENLVRSEERKMIVSNVEHGSVNFT
ncbi:uncharacterized protein LOC118201122 [Stegodyphus dumicola]|uniref:uncharacterized protein LOC118201122 n=1 Tax=Stegodyphus dumicola TaxID=202533 RepID=UPI0015AC7234|nr:uncharacterized protein LOC118201122 [Stegodyphus dumicola]